MDEKQRPVWKFLNSPIFVALVIVVGLPLAFRWEFVRTISRSTPVTSFAEDRRSYFSNYAEKEYVSEFTVSELRDTPRWSPTTAENPPLSPGRAAVLAQQTLAKLFPNVTEWIPRSISLELEQDRSFYLIELVPPAPSDSLRSQTGAGMRMIVLMDGRVVEPRITQRGR